MRERYNANRTGDKAEPCSNPTSTLNKEDKRLF